MYSKNLGTGDGIELVKILKSATATNQVGKGEMTLSVFPNPCNESTNISFNLEKESDVSLSLISSDGRIISVLANKHELPGTHLYHVNTNEIENGIYICRLQAKSSIDSELKTVKLVVQ